MAKCQLCKVREAEWAMQYVASDEPSFACLGWHYRGLRVTKVCDECKAVVQQKVAARQAGREEA